MKCNVSTLRARAILAALFVVAPLSLIAQESAAEDGSEDAISDAGLEVIEVDSLQELLDAVKERRIIENEEHRQREKEFAGARDRQAQLLREAEEELAAENRRSTRLDETIQENDLAIGNLQEQYDEDLGRLKEMFGVLTQAAGDARSVFEGSLISLQHPGRGDYLNALAAKMGDGIELPTREEIETMWLMILREMNESAKLARFTDQINRSDGTKEDIEMIRVGTFNLVAQDGYVNYDLNLKSVVDLPRQPSAEFSNTAEDLYEADPGELVAFAIDPTRGALLGLEIQRATLGEMVGTPFGGMASGHCWLPFCDGQGGWVGSIIILVGIIGVLLAIERLVTLTLMRGKINKQRDNLDEPDSDNPLGRVVQVYEENREVDVETLQLKLGDAVLQEMPGITRNITIIQVISVVAPLMGLLGTVIGMILTFQAITLFGTGDPKIMASGISTALMTTVLGLCVAIPTVLLHALVAQRSRGVIHILDEQSEGIVASHAESAGRTLD